MQVPRQAQIAVGVVLISGIWAAAQYFGRPASVGFLERDKGEIQKIAKSICAAANVENCAIAWGGKHKWFGTLEPTAKAQGVAGLEHVRQALGRENWTLASQPNGTQFTNGLYEVFVSTASGAITITSTESER